MRNIFGLIAIVGLAAGQTATGPTLGYSVAADGRSVRTIFGVPGASRMSAAVSLPDDLKMLRLSPASSVGVAAAGDPAMPIVYDVMTGTRTVLDGARTSPGAVTWSALGTAFAVAYAESSWVQVYVANAGGYRLADEFAADGRVAISDDGTAALVLSGGGLQLRNSDGLTSLADGAVAAFAFVAGGRTAVFQAADGLTIGSVKVANIVDGDDTVYLGSPAKDRVIAIRASGQTTVFDATGQVLAADTCGAPAKGLEFIGRAGTLVSTSDNAAAPLCLADAGVNPRIYFVPPPADLTGADQ